MSGARCLWRRWCSGHRRVRPPAWCALLGRAAWCARGRRPAREPSALRASLGASSRSPARPRHRPRAPQPGPPAPSTLAVLVSLCVVELPLEARSGPAAAHGLRSRAFRTLRRSPHRRRLCRCVWWSFPSKLGQAPPPPTGAAAWPSGALALLFCCLWHRWCSGRRRARPPARSPHASLRLGVVDLEARPGPPDPPAPSTPAALAALCVVELPLEARPSPAAAHGCRSRALRTLRHPPCRRCCRDLQLIASLAGIALDRWVSHYVGWHCTAQLLVHRMRN